MISSHTMVDRLEPDCLQQTPILVGSEFCSGGRRVAGLFFGAKLGKAEGELGSQDEGLSRVLDVMCRLAKAASLKKPDRLSLAEPASESLMPAGKPRLAF